MTTYQRVAVKICGVTNLNDAKLIADLGADYLGFIFVAETPRFIPLGVAQEIARKLREIHATSPKIIGVFMNQSLAEIRAALAQVPLDGVQLHGQESPEFCRELAGTFRIKVFRVSGPESLAAVDDYDTEAILCDTYVRGVPGGTGRTFDHSLVQSLARRRRLFLSGGLTPDNVVTAVEHVRPFGVDLASGVEEHPGRKDPAKLKKLFARLQGAGLR